MKTIALRLTGVAPLVMHNTQLSDPRYVRGAGIKAITSKRTKTEEDEAELMRLEFIAGLYWNDRGPYLPGVNVDAALAQAASQAVKGGKKLVQSCLMTDDAQLEYGGRHKTPDALFAVPDHMLYVPAVVPSTKSRVMRARPIFKQWAATVTISYHSLSEEQILQFAGRAGDFIGICDWRPRYGRFEVKKI